VGHRRVSIRLFRLGVGSGRSIFDPHEHYDDYGLGYPRSSFDFPRPRIHDDHELRDLRSSSNSLEHRSYDDHELGNLRGEYDSDHDPHDEQQHHHVAVDNAVTARADIIADLEPVLGPGVYPWYVDTVWRRYVRQCAVPGERCRAV
jgi:hypothetical protein